jgi:hypothetical protein
LTPSPKACRSSEALGSGRRVELSVKSEFYQVCVCVSLLPSFDQVAAMRDVIAGKAAAILPGVQCHAVGSFRRGNASSGDMV